MKIDTLDENILRVLAKNGSTSNRSLAKKLGVSEATIRRRKFGLIESNLLRIVGVVDPVGLGYEVCVIFGLGVEHTRVDEALKTLALYPEISWVLSTTGRFDVIAMARFTSASELYNFLREQVANIKGLKNSETFLCMAIEKGRYSAMFTNLPQ